MHISAVRKAGLGSLTKGARLSYELVIRAFIVPNGCFDCLSTLAHGVWVCIKTLLHSFEQMLMLPSRNSPFWATDWYWRIPAVRLADAHAATALTSTYMYEFAWRSPQFGGRLGAGHSVEIPFVFDTLGLGTEPLLGRDPPQSLATRMHNAWVAFATDGDCGWPKYDIARRPTMHFDTKSEIVDDPLAAKLALWKGVR